MSIFLSVVHLLRNDDLLFSCGVAPFMITHSNDFFVGGFANQFRATDASENETTNYIVIAGTMPRNSYTYLYNISLSWDPYRIETTQKFHYLSINTIYFPILAGV